MDSGTASAPSREALAADGDAPADRASASPTPAKPSF